MSSLTKEQTQTRKDRRADKYRNPEKLDHIAQVLKAIEDHKAMYGPN